MSNSSGEDTIKALAIASAFVVAAIVLGVSTICPHWLGAASIGAAGLYGVSALWLHHPQPTALKAGLFGGISAVVSGAIVAGVGGFGGWLLGVLGGAALCVGLILLAMKFWPSK